MDTTDHISFQLYSSRNVSSQEAFLAELAQLGYTQVEGYEGIYHEPEKFRTAMNRSGLTMPSGHFSVSDLESNLSKCLEIADVLGIRNIYAPYLSAKVRPTNVGGWKIFGERLAMIAEKVGREGFIFGWHNHDFEFTTLNEATYPIEYILDTDTSVTFEVDVAWMVVAGEDPMVWLDRYTDRISSVHVKDIAIKGECVDEDGWSDVGSGTLPWEKIMAWLRKNTKDVLYVMEHDKPLDSKRFAHNSIKAFKKF